MDCSHQVPLPMEFSRQEYWSVLHCRQILSHLSHQGSPHIYMVVLVAKNLPANAGDTGDMGLISGSGRSPGGGHGNPLQHSCLENPMNRGASQATVHSITESDMTEPT